MCCDTWRLTEQGVELAALGSIVLQSGGVCSQHHIPVLHLTGSLSTRLESELINLLLLGSIVHYNRSAPGLRHAADNNLVPIAYEQVAHRSRLHPSICRRVVQEALSLLSHHISGPHSLQVSMQGSFNDYISGYA